MRSGTTVVGEYLGSFGESAFVGELINTWRAVSRNQLCSCGSPAHECPVWSAVCESREMAYRLDSLRRRVDRQRRLLMLQRMYDRPESTWRPDVRNWVHSLREQARNLSESLDASVLVDTSKSPAGLALARLAFRENLSVVHVIRHPAAVGYSQSRNHHTRSVSQPDTPAERTVSSSARLWTLMNVEAAYIARSVPDRYGLIYEHLSRDPRSELEQLAGHLGLHVDPPRWVTRDRVMLRAQHVIAGNPSRLDSRERMVAARPFDQTSLRWSERIAVASQAGVLYPLLRRLN